MKAKYVTFEQAKLLFEKGFTLFTENTKSVASNNRYGDNEHYSFYKDATNWDISGYPSLKEKCIVTFHEKVGTNSSEINSLLTTYGIWEGNNGGIKSYLAAEQWQVIEWLRVSHGIWVRVDCIHSEWWVVSLNNASDGSFKVHPSLIAHPDYIVYKTPQEAYSAAFDYILKELIDEHI